MHKSLSKSLMACLLASAFVGAGSAAKAQTVKHDTNSYLPTAADTALGAVANGWVDPTSAWQISSHKLTGTGGNFTTDFLLRPTSDGASISQGVMVEFVYASANAVPSVILDQNTASGTQGGGYLWHTDGSGNYGLYISSKGVGPYNGVTIETLPALTAGNSYVIDARVTVTGTQASTITCKIYNGTIASLGTLVKSFTTYNDTANDGNYTNVGRPGIGYLNAPSITRVQTFDLGVSVTPSITTMTNASTGNTVNLTGVGTTWTSGTVWSVTPAVAGGASIASQTYTSATSMSLSVNAGYVTGQIYTFTEPNGGTFQVTATANGTLTLANIAQTGAGIGSVTWTAYPNDAQTASYTYQWYGSATDPAFTANSGSLIAGATAQTYTKTGLAAGTPYYVKCLVTNTANSQSHTTDTARAGVATGAKLYFSPLYPRAFNLIAAGDSITFAGLAQTQEAAIYALIPGVSSVSIGNQGHSGTSTTNWLPTDTASETSGGNLATNFYNTALTAANTAGAGTLIEFQIGTNDAALYTLSASTFRSQLHTICSGWAAAGHPVILHYPPWNASASTNALLVQYLPQIDAECDGINVLAGDRSAYNLFAQNPFLLGDGTHPTNLQGYPALGALRAYGVQKALLEAPIAATTTTTINGTKRKVQ